MICSMRTLDVVGIRVSFNELFMSAQFKLFKAEVLQDYTAVDDSPSLRAWLDGNKERSRELGRKDESIAAWRKQCLDSPATITRVHVVAEPYTPYLEWEVTVIYQDSLLLSGAENVLLASSSKLINKELPAGDFWIFDDRRVLQWEYENGVGNLVGGKVWNDGDTIETFLAFEERLLSIAKAII